MELVCMTVQIILEINEASYSNKHAPEASPEK